MKFAMKNDDGIELHLDKKERELLYKALRHYIAYGKNGNYIEENLESILEIENVLELSEFYKKEGEV